MQIRSQLTPGARLISRASKSDAKALEKTIDFVTSNSQKASSVFKLNPGFNRSVKILGKAGMVVMVAAEAYKYHHIIDNKMDYNQVNKMYGELTNPMLYIYNKTGGRLLNNITD